MKSLNYLLLPIVLFVSLNVMGQDKEKDTDFNIYLNIQDKRSFLKNDTKYWEIRAGALINCKYKVGITYSWLKNSFTTDAFPVDLTVYTDARSKTKTDGQFYALSFSPIVLAQKKINISVPVSFGISSVTSRYQNNSLFYTEYYNENPLFGEIGVDVDIRFLGFMRIGASAGFRGVAADLEVAKEAFNTPYIGLGLKFGKNCSE